MDIFQKVLWEYWKYPNFRPLQKEIITSIYKGKDTLGLMPTGGGKSITFQVPTLALDTMCLVVSPLVALMKDQVSNLLNKNIKAVAIYSGLGKVETDVLINHCIYGNVKFLYVTPERLQSKKFINALEQMSVGILAVDEAHCISEWGYDFRPSYLQIATIREILPTIPLLALTATATKEVEEDIQEKLHFKEKNVFRKSFERKNLHYIVRHQEDKYRYLLKILNKVKGSSIVYVRNRLETKEISKFLNKHNKTADYFHAGLLDNEKSEKQANWQSDKIPTIVATNAFGMGIDKPNVRVVVHMDLPNSIEAYFQEAGRAGRDEKDSFAVLLFNKKDEKRLKKILTTQFPPKAKIKKVYTSIANYLNVGVEEAKNQPLSFDITEFCYKFKFYPSEVYYSLKILKQAQYINFTSELENPSRLHFIVRRDDLYKFQISNEKFDTFIKLILRLYSGVFSIYVKINEKYIAQVAKTDSKLVYAYLQKLSKLKIIHYIPSLKSSYIEFIDGRLPVEAIQLSNKIYADRRKVVQHKMEEMIRYANLNKCRSIFLLNYFDEKYPSKCGNCDVCKQKTENDLSQTIYKKICENIKLLTQDNPKTIEYICANLDFNENKIFKVIRWLVDQKKISLIGNNKLKWEIGRASCRERVCMFV